MIIPIDDKYRIAADTHAWMVQQYRGQDKQGKHLWQSVGWYSSLRNAVQGLVDRCVRTSEAETVADALDDINALVSRLTKALEPVVEVRRVS